MPDPHTQTPLQLECLRCCQRQALPQGLEDGGVVGTVFLSLFLLTSKAVEGGCGI